MTELNNPTLALLGWGTRQWQIFLRLSMLTSRFKARLPNVPLDLLIREQSNDENKFLTLHCL